MELLMVYLGWLAVLLFLAGAAYKIYRLAAMPLHLRWELYPVAHEPRPSGGSYMEEIDYVQKPRHVVLFGEIKELLSEVFILKRVREHNRFGIWPFSMAMHWGIYLFFFWAFLLIGEGLFNLTFISPLTNLVGPVSFFLGAAGSLGLILKRAANEELGQYTTPADYFNLIFLLAIFGTGLFSWFTEPSLSSARTYVQSVLFFRPAPAAVPTLVNFLLFELFLIYMPFTKLLHYAAKFFTFHKVLWDDGVNTKGSAIDKRITAQLAFPVTWAAPHIAPGKTWAEEAQIVDGRDVDNE